MSVTGMVLIIGIGASIIVWEKCKSVFSNSNNKTEAGKKAEIEKILGKNLTQEEFENLKNKRD